MKKIILALTGILLSGWTIAQQVRPATSGEIYHEIAQLKNLTNVLYLAAHPDDENTRLLAWLVNDQHIRTAYLSLTRGDGGQNILGNELGAALGLIRTHELLEARKLDGAGQFFTRAVDFGFSKTADETFKHWDRDILINDIVWVMRKYRPDVVICRFPPNELAGHGQHAASAILAADAFHASGDSTKYTDQLAYYRPWQPRRLLWNTFRFGNRNTTSENQYKTAVGNYSPLMGMGYGELAGISRSIHKSQGAGTPSTPGVQKEYFKLVAGDTLSTSLFDGIDITWNRVGRPEISRRIDKILEEYNFNKPEAILPALLNLRKEIVTVRNRYWRTEKLKELDRLILHAAGFMGEITTKQPETVAGTALPFSARIIVRPGDLPVNLKSITWIQGNETQPLLALSSDSLYTFEREVAIPADQPITEPYWLSIPNDDALFPVPNDSLLGYPTTPNTLTGTVELSIDDQDFSVPIPLSFKKLDPTKGDVIEQLRIIPDVSLEFDAPLILVNADGSVKTNIHIRAFKDLDDVNLRIYNTEFSKDIKNIRLRTGLDTLIPVSLTAAEASKAGKEDFYLAAVISKGQQGYSESQHKITYDHLPTLQYFTKPYAKVLRRDWKVTVKRIGYLEGAGDMTISLLRSAGLQVDVLKPDDLANAEKLGKYEAIITGIRAINTQKEMKYWMPVLEKYVKNGGTLVMQYNTLQDMATTNLGPYPLTLSNQRVTEEDAAVRMLLPQHKLLNYPNKITDKDFDGWVQERGLYFPSKWDEKYQPLFSMNDTGEKPLEGSTLYTQYGKGHYIYTSLAFFRQLPAGNKGAIRLLMNMLSAGK
jgi:LmbE family N-acetylglucosaminyl deacetylase